MENLGRCGCKEGMVMLLSIGRGTFVPDPIPEKYGMRCISRFFLRINRLVDRFARPDAELQRMAE
jgi:hypothetical protein